MLVLPDTAGRLLPVGVLDGRDALDGRDPLEAALAGVAAVLLEGRAALDDPPTAELLLVEDGRDGAALGVGAADGVLLEGRDVEGAAAAVVGVDPPYQPERPLEPVDAVEPVVLSLPGVDVLDDEDDDELLLSLSLAISYPIRLSL